MFGKERDSASAGVVGAAISDLSRRLSKLEDTANTPRPAEKQRGMDVFKALASWPAFGLIALALFFVPIHGLLNALAVKLCTAEEVKVWEVSFTERLETSALKLGEADLAKTIPKLSPLAVGLLLRGSANATSLLKYSYVEEDAKFAKSFGSPTVAALKAIFELRDSGLVEINNGPGEIDVDMKRFWSEVDALREKHQAVELPYFDSDTVHWKPTGSIRLKVEDLPKTQWKLSDRGIKAAATIVDTVQKELAGTPPRSKCLKLIGA